MENFVPVVSTSKTNVQVWDGRHKLFRSSLFSGNEGVGENHVILRDLELCTAFIMRCSYEHMWVVCKEWLAVFLRQVHFQSRRKALPEMRLKFYFKFDEVVCTRHVTVNVTLLCWKKLRDGSARFPSFCCVEHNSTSDTSYTTQRDFRRLPLHSKHIIVSNWHQAIIGFFSLFLFSLLKCCTCLNQRFCASESGDLDLNESQWFLWIFFKILSRRESSFIPP